MGWLKSIVMGKEVENLTLFHNIELKMRSKVLSSVSMDVSKEFQVHNTLMNYFNSRRSTVVARQGIVATSQPLAAQAGLQMLIAGGNAIDAAVATAAALSVLEPMSTGLGGDMFCLIWEAKTKQVTALNGSGRSPKAAQAETLLRKGYQRIPLSGPEVAYSITVPGVVEGWQTVLEQAGRMTLKEVLKPAILYAKQGFGVSEIIAYAWQEYANKLKAHPSGQEFLLHGRAPRYGEVMSVPTLAKTLEQISEGGKEVFYHGELAEKTASFVQSQGGWLTTQDLAAHTSTWDTPIKTSYRGVTVWECPPNGQGLTALLALNIAENFNFPAFYSVERYHYLIEAMRLGFADALHYIADPVQQSIPVQALLSKKYAEKRHHLIHADQALQDIHYGDPASLAGDTVYISVIDQEGNACSFINSLYWGSGLVVPGTGIALHNRGASFSLDPQHPNFLQGNKRPYHTLMPALATRNDELWLCFGVMGAFQQPQGHLQVVSNMVDFNLDPQKALDALRFSINLETHSIQLEAGLPEELIRGLQRKGHAIEIIDGHARTHFGGGQIIARDHETGVLYAGSEPRKDGAAVGY